MLRHVSQRVSTLGRVTCVTSVTDHINNLTTATRLYRADTTPVVTHHDSNVKDTGVKSMDDIPGPSGIYSLPYIGSMFLFHPFTRYKPEKSNEMFTELYKTYGPIVKFRKGWNWSVILFDPDLIEETVSNEGRCPIRPSPPLPDAYSARTGRKKGLSQVQGEDWIHMRRPLNEFMLNSSSIAVYLPLMNEVSNELVRIIHRTRQENGSVNIDNLLLRYAVESSSLYSINTRLHFLSCSQDHQNGDLRGNKQLEDQGAQATNLLLTEEERNHMLKMIRLYMSSIGAGYYTFPLYKYIHTKLYQDFATAAKFLLGVVQSRLASLAEEMKRKACTSEQPNLLHNLLTDGRLDFNTCVAMVTGFITAASENVSNSLNLLLWQLAKNSSKQEILRKEIFSRLPLKDTVTDEELNYMPYLKACLKESLRLAFPSPLGSVRVMPEDVTIAGYHIPAGTCVNFGHNVLGHSGDYFESPEEFKPERWLHQPTSEAERSLRHRQAVITMPFGFGKRNCVGKRLASQQIHIAVIKILQHFRLELSNPDEKLDVVYKITAIPAQPLDIRFYPLNSH